LKAIYKVAATESWGDGFLIGIKAALEILGVPAGPPAGPLRACDAAEREVIAGILREGGLL
jgi:dihydrodipicolinate synthase/N-acetylneuraminate lyase